MKRKPKDYCTRQIRATKSRLDGCDGCDGYTRRRLPLDKPVNPNALRGKELLDIVQLISGGDGRNKTRLGTPVVLVAHRATRARGRLKFGLAFLA